MQKKFHRSFDSLENIFEFTEGFFADENVAQSIRYPVHFVMEELFTNMVKYNPGNTNDILLDVGANDGGVTVRLTDFDVDNFDVSEIPDVDVEMTLDQILADHPTGQTYAHLLKGLDHYPLLRDARDEVLSMPPIINSASLGRVEVGAPLLYLNSINDVALAINQGNFSTEFGILSGPDWSIIIEIR